MFKAFLKWLGVLFECSVFLGMFKLKNRLVRPKNLNITLKNLKVNKKFKSETNNPKINPKIKNKPTNSGHYNSSQGVFTVIMSPRKLLHASGHDRCHSSGDASW